MTSSPRLALLALSIAFALPACKAEQPVPEGIRPEISALPSGQVLSPMRPAVAAGETWNAREIDWQTYDAGIAKAKAENKPVCLVLYTNWCPHCRNYSRVFEDPKVVEQAGKFVMIRANADEEQALASKFTQDGGYVPRTFFLSPDGALAPEIHAPRPKFLYFFDERDPRSLLGGMEAALKKWAR